MKLATSGLESSGRVKHLQTGSSGSFQPLYPGDPRPALPASGCFVRRPARRRRILHSRDRESTRAYPGTASTSLTWKRRPRQLGRHSASRRFQLSHKFKPKPASSAAHIIGCPSGDVITSDVARASRSLAPEAWPRRPEGEAAFLGVAVATRAVVSGSRGGGAGDSGTEGRQTSVAPTDLSPSVRSYKIPPPMT